MPCHLILLPASHSIPTHPCSHCPASQVIHDAGSKCGVRTVCVYGGVPKKEQVDALRRGVEVVVGTPGRLEDLMGEGACVLDVSEWWPAPTNARLVDACLVLHMPSLCAGVITRTRVMRLEKVALKCDIEASCERGHRDKSQTSGLPTACLPSYSQLAC